MDSTAVLILIPKDVLGELSHPDAWKVTGCYSHAELGLSVLLALKLQSACI